MNTLNRSDFLEREEKAIRKENRISFCKDLFGAILLTALVYVITVLIFSIKGA